MRSDLLAIFAVILIIAVFQLPAPDSISKSNVLAQVVESESKNPPPEIEAKSAYAENFATGEILYEKNGSYPLPLASLTKIVSALVILDLANLNETAITLSGEHFLVRDLLAMVMVESSNGAMATLLRHAAGKNGQNIDSAEEWFLDLISKKAEMMESGGMIFGNATGLDLDENSASSLGSARGILKIAKNSLDSPLWQLGAIHEVVSHEGKRYELKATNLLEDKIPGLIGAKTGLTDLAGGNLLIIFERPLGHPIGIVVLGSTESGRFEDVRKIYEWIKLR